MRGEAPVRNDLLLGLALWACLVWLLYPGLFFSHVPAFRDAYHFYYPQAVWLDQHANQGDYFPAWNFDEGLGVSVIGQPSSAVFYPLRIFWLLPGLSVAQRFAVAILAHSLLAAAGMRYAAYHFRLSNSAGWLAAISYSLSCPIFFQHSNFIYLCSAAWIGFALGSLQRFSSVFPGRWTSVHWRSCLTFSAACSLMFLAGDPHTAVNALIVAGLLLSLLSLRWLIAHARDGSDTCRNLASVSGWYALAIVLVVGLTAIQWLPALRWSRHSNRGWAEANTNLVAEPALAAALTSNLERPHTIYDFSLSPWHIVTALWPTLGGHYVPDNSRLFAAVPAEGRMWLPSLYFGLIPCCLLLSLKALPRGLGWLWGLLIFSCVAALGNYSLTWLLREVCAGLGLDGLAEALPRDHVGSLYWLLTKLIPNYEVFRYPAKWSVWIVAAGGLLAAVQLDRRLNSRLHKLDVELIPRRLWAALFGLSLAGLGATFSLLVVRGFGLDLDAWLAEAAADRWLGPPRSTAIAHSLMFAFALPLGLSGVRLLRVFEPTRLLWITLLDLTICASWWIAFAPPPDLAQAVVDADQRAEAQHPFVWIDRSEANLVSDRWLSEDKLYLSQQLAYQEHFQMGKLGLLSGARSLAATQSITPASLACLQAWLRSHDDLTAEQPELDSVLQQLGVTHRLVRWRPDDAPAQFSWQVVEGLPLCEIELESPGAVRAEFSNRLTWRWLAAGHLAIELADPLITRPSVAGGQVASTYGRLLVRQYNDGGWIAELASGAPLPIATDTWLLEIPIPAGATKFVLRRRWLH